MREADAALIEADPNDRVLGTRGRAGWSV